MEYIKSWLKTILYMNVLLLICDNLMQKTAYEKYYRFFSGFLLVVCLLKPVIDFAGTEQYFQVSFLQEEWKNERNLLGNVKEFQDMQDVLKKEYETAYKNQIEEIAIKIIFSIPKSFKLIFLGIFLSIFTPPLQKHLILLNHKAALKSF